MNHADCRNNNKRVFHSATILMTDRPKNEKRLIKELKSFDCQPIEYISASPIQVNDLTVWQASIIGPKETPYESGIFLLDVRFPDQYPFKPLTINFTTNIYHPNVNSSGAIDLDILYDSWNPAITLPIVLRSIYALLSEPNLDSPLMPSIADQYKYDRSKFDSIARQWTKLYAT